MILLACIQILFGIDLPGLERARVVPQAEQYLQQSPVTITSFLAPNSAGGRHEYYSEGDYWWPDPDHPEGPFIRKDGQTNPANFVAHRHALMQMSVQVSTLVAAYRLTHDERFASHALAHLKAWFADSATAMHPHLNYAQAIRGRVTGRGVGIIDTIHLIEVVRAVEVLEEAHMLDEPDAEAVRRWFRDYLRWLTSHPYGLEERDAKNNHGTWWVAQVASFSRFVGDSAMMDSCRRRYKETLLPGQVGPDGGFPLELARTKPYAYSLFNLEGMALICELLSSEHDNLWTYELRDGRSIQRALDFMFPFVQDKSRWEKPPDVMYYEDLPVRQGAWLFAARALEKAEFAELWRTLRADQTVEEIIRNFPVRQPVLWH